MADSHSPGIPIGRNQSGERLAAVRGDYAKTAGVRIHRLRIRHVEIPPTGCAHLRTSLAVLRVTRYVGDYEKGHFFGMLCSTSIICSRHPNMLSAMRALAGQA